MREKTPEIMRFERNMFFNAGLCLVTTITAMVLVIFFKPSTMVELSPLLFVISTLWLLGQGSLCLAEAAGRKRGNRIRDGLCRRAD